MPKTYVPIRLDKERRLLVNFSAMCSFEEATGKKYLDFMSETMQTGSMAMTDVRALLWACLIHEDETLTLKQVSDLVEYESVTGILKALQEAMLANMPEPKEGDRPLEESRPES